TLLEWTSALEELKSIPYGEIFERLKICFDSLDDHQKAIFLDIAFFFIGMDEDNAIQILDSCGFHTKIHLHSLIQKCLLTIREKKLRMHDLLQEMAREIVRRENPGEPGERSRLSFYKDVRKVLKYHEGTDKVIGLKGFFPPLREKSFSTGALAGMKKVRILQLRNADIVGRWEQFSKELRWLCWERCPWLSIPPSLNLKKLVVLRLCHSKLQYIWEQSKVLKNLKVLDLSHSHDLVRTSDISGLLNIEKLIFRGCINLIEFFIRLKHASNVCQIGLNQQCPPEACRQRPHEACFDVAFAQLKSSHEISTSTDCYCWPRKKKKAIFFHTSTSLMAASFPSDPCWNYDVFLSFRGEDVRNNFLAHLYSALNQVGFRTYKDDSELARGSDIAPSLLEAIEHSRIAIVVFSKNYADSRSCLDELVKILDCRDKLGQIVLPIFFHVDPSDVRKQRGSFGKAFTRAHHQKATVDKVEKWKTALTNAANLAGFDLQSVNRDESKLIKKIIEDIWEKLHPTYLSDVNHLFGIVSPVERIISLLRLGSKDVRFIGIYGMPGIGKTTVAKVIRNRIFPEFDGNSLLEDVQLGSKHGGLVELQKRLLYDILRVQGLHLNNIDDGIDKIRGRLKYKKVLIILDNVDHLDQLAALSKERSWFGIGSRIIVTCRDEHLLNAHGVDVKYEVPSLCFPYAEQLFSWHAFRQLCPPDDYADFSPEIMRYAGGHPLALKVLGSFLSDKNLLEWTSALEELKSTPHGEIFERLKICFDSLNDHQQSIFLDIAFFFVGMDEDDTIQILDGCGFHTKIHLRSLIQKCLLTTREKKLRMHDLLQEMAREIVRRENLSEPGERSRLSFYKDVHKVLKDKEGTNKVIGLKGFFPETRKKPFDTEALARMSKLRILQLRNANFVGKFEHFSKELRWLCWERYPQVSIQSSLNLKKLVDLRLRNSKLKYIWDVSKVLKNLKVLDLSHSLDLIGTSDISGLLNIEKLIFKGCINLIEVHQSIGNLSKLIYLDLENCQNLVHLPTEICKLRFLENLNLYLCSKLEELPEDFGNMESLKELNIGCTAIKHLPMSIGHLKNLTNFFWNNERSLLESPGTYNLSPLWSLTSVKELNLSFCKLSDNSFPRDLSGLENLETLLLRGNTFHHLPIFLSNLPKLKKLDVSKCDLSGRSGPLVVASPFLQELNLNQNNFCSLPVDLTSLPLKTKVFLVLCKKLKVIESESHTILITYHCKSLEKVTFKGGLSNRSLRSIFPRFDELTSIPYWSYLKPLTGKQLAKLEHLLGLKASLKKWSHFFKDFILTRSKDRPIQGFSDYMEPIYNIFLPKGTMPYGFNYKHNVAWTTVDVPQVSSGSFQGLAVCVFYHISNPLRLAFAVTIEDKDFSHHYHANLYGPFGGFDEDEFMWISCWRTPGLVNECKRFSIKVEINVTDGSVRSHFWIVDGIGIRLLSEKELDLVTDIWRKSTWIGDMEPSADPVFLNSIRWRNSSEGWGWEESTIRRRFTLTE
ncbi:hypothetical protein SLEP1_g59653, partial [Rubroshorea leprosula]